MSWGEGCVPGTSAGQDDDDDADDEVDYGDESDDSPSTDDWTVGLPVTDPGVLYTSSVASKNSDNTYLDTIGRYYQDSSLQHSAFNGGMGPSSGDVSPQAQSPSEPTRKSDFGNANEADPDLTVGPSIPREVEFSPDTNFDLSPRPSIAATLPLDSSQNAVVDLTMGIRLSVVDLVAKLALLRGRGHL